MQLRHSPYITLLCTCLHAELGLDTTFMFVMPCDRPDIVVALGSVWRDVCAVAGAAKA